MPSLQRSVVMHDSPHSADRPSTPEPSDLSSSSFDRSAHAATLHHPAAFDAGEYASPTPSHFFFSPVPQPPMSACALTNHAAALLLPPPLSLFPSMSAADDFSQLERQSLELQHFIEPAGAPHLSLSDSASRFVDVPPSLTSSSSSSSSPSAEPFSACSSSCESLPASPAPPPSHSWEQRKRSKQVKQRRADMHRRQREAAALSQMKQLIAAARQHADTPDNTAVADTQPRARILERGAKRMRELQLLVDLLSQTCDAQQREIQALSQRLDPHDSSDWSHGSSLPPFPFFQQKTSTLSDAAAPSKRMRLLATHLASTLDESIGHRTLQSASFTPVAVAGMLVECSSGAVLDVNDGLLSQGWQRDHLVGRTVMESYETVVAEKGWELGENEERMLLVPSPVDGQLRPSARPAQYERSKRLMRELYGGGIGVCVAVWRVFLADGYLHEVESTTWIDGWESACDAAGRLLRRPLRAVTITSLGDSQRID